MLFLSGPRQVGKTTLVKNELCKGEGYFNWDLPAVRSSYRKDQTFFLRPNLKPSDWICFDEIHKRSQWKDILKGIFDAYSDQCRFIVTGSALLETFKKSGDSLVGRYFNTHLFPINLGDFRKSDFKFYPQGSDFTSAVLDSPETAGLKELLEFGGFPEPFYAASESFWKRWSIQHQDLIVHQDLRDLTRIQELDKIEALLEMLKPGLGNPVSNLSLARDLEASHTTVKNWLLQLEKVQLIFKVSPYSKNIRRSLSKEVKWYFSDWRLAEKDRFENYLAATLLRAVTLWKDRFGEAFSLHYIRTHSGQEVDFLICLNRKPYLLIESKEGKPDPTSACHQFADLLKVPCLIITAQSGIARKVPGAEIFQISASRLGTVLP